MKEGVGDVGVRGVEGWFGRRGVIMCLGWE